MGWESELFAFLDDIEAQAEGAFSVERDLEVADRSRGDYAAIAFAGRLMASTGLDVRLQVLGTGMLAGRIARVAEGWCLLESGSQSWIVRQEAISSVLGLSGRSVPADVWPVTARLGFGSALRRISESGSRCQVRMVDGLHHDVRPVRVGADFLEAETGSHGERGIYRFAAIAAVGQVASAS